MGSAPANICPKHPGMPLTAKCITCGKPICGACRVELGYFCSEECRNKSRGSVDHKAKKEHQQNVESTERIVAVLKTVFALIGIAAFAGIGWAVWKFALDPSGKLAWRWKCGESSSITILNHDENKIVLKAHDSIVSINSENGRVLTKNEIKGLSEYNEFVKICKNGYLFRNNKSAALAGPDGTLKWSLKFDGIVTAFSAGDEELVAFVMPEIKESESESDKVTFPPSSLMSVKIEDGRILWKKEAKAFVSAELAAGTKYFVYFSTKEENQDYVHYLKAADLKTGKDVWQIKIEGYPSLQPQIICNTVIFGLKNMLNGVSEDGKNKLWSLQVKDMFLEKQVKVFDNFLVVSGSDSIACVDLKEKKILWNNRLSGMAESVAYSSGKIFVTTAVSKESEVTEVKLPPSFEQIKDKDILPGTSEIMKSNVKLEGLVLCFDAMTGRELWKKEKAKGSIAANSDKVVLLNDTAFTQMLTIANEGKGELILTQLNPINGQEIMKRNTPEGITEPYMISGKIIIGLEYERTKSGLTGLLSGTAATETKFLGLAAFKLK